MKFEFILNEQDYLNSSLFTASKSAVIKKRRLGSRLIIPIVYIGLGIWFWDDYNHISTILFVLFAILWFLFSPIITRRRYVRYYKSAIKEAYSQRLGRTLSLEIQNDVLAFTEGPNESRFQASDIDVINEIPDLILIRIKSSNCIILPKERINNLDELKRQLKQLAERMKVNYNEELEWKWR